jgi:hypothetical protein
VGTQGYPCLTDIIELTILEAAENIEKYQKETKA